MAASRLPNKPLLKIKNKTMIMHVYDKATETNLGDVYVASSDKAIIEEVKNNGGKSIITSDHHRTGTDRIAEAIDKLGETNIDYVINLQGDEPLIDINDIKNLNTQAVKHNSDMATLACIIDKKEKFQNSNIVKVTTLGEINNENITNAISFDRLADFNSDNFIYHHIGIYIYKTSVLKKIVKFDQTESEKKNKLEQLRALDNGIKIDVILANSSPIGVDTKEDYIEIKKLMEYKK